MSQITAPVARAAKPQAPAVSLLESMRALDGSKEDRFNVAHAALYSAYSVALSYGNKTQLMDVRASTGKKVCERAMRQAVIAVGDVGKHKDAATLQDTLDKTVAQALDLFASVACVTKVAAPKVAKASPVAQPADVAASVKGFTPQQKAEFIALTVNQEAVLSYAATLDDIKLAAMADAIMAVVEQRMRAAQPALKAA